jgi:Gpi18-like mannosyltransferase
MIQLLQLLFERNVTQVEIFTTVEKPLETSKEETIQPQKSQIGEITRNVIIPFITTRMALVAIGLLTIYYILPLINPHQPIYSNLQTLPFHQMLYQMWAHFDSGFYAGIARRGYPVGPHALDGMSYWAFFPLYPIAIKLLMWPMGVTGNHAVIAGIIVSNISSLVACIYLYKLAKWEFDSKTAQRAVLYMLIYPMGFYLSAVYSEGLFMALSIGCIYHARKRQWLRASILGGLAAFTRPQGIFLTLVVAWECWRAHKGHWKSQRAWLDAAWIPIIPTGLISFCMLAKQETGDFFAFIKVEENGWGRQSSNPILVVWDALQHHMPATPYTWQFYSFNMMIIFLCWFLFVVIVFKMPFMYSILTFTYLYMPLASGNIGSVGRLYLITFPLYMIAAWWSSKSEIRHSVIVAACSMLLGLMMAMFVIGVYAVA